MVDSHALGACGCGRAGSNPAFPTKNRRGTKKLGPPRSAKFLRLLIVSTMLTQEKAVNGSRKTIRSIIQ